MRKGNIKMLSEKGLIVALIDNSIKYRNKPTKKTQKVLCWMLDDLFIRLGASVDREELPHILSVATS